MARRKPTQIQDDTFVREVIRQSVEQYRVRTTERIKAEMLEMVAEEIDEKMASLKAGQALGIIFRVEVINRDGTLLTEPSARQSPENFEWRDAVFKRDGYACQDCGKRDDIHAHHLDSWADHPARRFDVDNGVTLCVDCHAARHPDRARWIRSSPRRREKGTTNGTPE